MSKALFSKSLLLFTIHFLSINLLIGQDSLELRGRLLVDMQIVDGAAVTVFDGKKVVYKTKTNGVGNFFVKVAYGGEYVVQFKKSYLPVQKIILNTLKKNNKKINNKERIVLTLSSNKSSKEGPNKRDAVASFRIRESGKVTQEAISNPNDASEAQVKVEQKIDNLEKTVKDEIKKMPEQEKNTQLSDYEALQRKKDSILLMAKQKAKLIISDANREAEIVREANKNLEKKYNRPIIDAHSNIHTKISRELKKFALSESKFLSQKKVKNYHDVINKYSKKENLSSQDSLEYLNNVMRFNEEVIKSAWLQLEVDKLNAKTQEDSIALQKREIEIRIAEQKIAEAKDKIELQNTEIKYKNIIITFVVLALLILMVFSFMMYVSIRNKKKSNTILAKKNSEIANKNKKILDSIRYAQTIQQAALPIKSKIDKHFEWFVVYLPKDIVSGDFYWFHHFTDSGVSVFAVVDCTGHGVPGAFMSLIGNRLLVEAVKEKGLVNTIEILEEIDQGIRFALMQDETSNNDGMDVCICTIKKLDNDKREIHFAGAKRPLFYTDKSSEKINFIKGTVRGIGGRKRLRQKNKKLFVEHELLLDKGDKLYLTTDGVFDLQSPDRKKFGRPNFMTLLKKHKDNSLKEQEEEIIKIIGRHSANEPQIDDITVLGIKL